MEKTAGVGGGANPFVGFMTNGRPSFCLQML